MKKGKWEVIWESMEMEGNRLIQITEESDTNENASYSYTLSPWSDKKLNCTFIFWISLCHESNWTQTGYSRDQFLDISWSRLLLFLKMQANFIRWSCSDLCFVMKLLKCEKTTEKM